MALTPLILIFADRLLTVEKSLEGVDPAMGLKGQVLMIGFGRFGQIASQVLLLRGIEVSIIESSPDRIREAERFGFKIYYGDGTRLDILHHSGAADAEVIMICTDDRRATSHIAELILAEFPMAKVLVRSYDRSHTLELRRMGVDYDIRETVESAYLMGGEGLRALGAAEEDIREGMDEIRTRDEERLALQEQGINQPLKDALDKGVTPEPLSRVRRMIDHKEKTD
ncbi:NAD-binding protein [Paracoccus cavernae]